MKAVAVFSGTKEVSYMTFVPADLRDVAVLVEPLTIGEKAFAQVALIQSRLPWLDPDAPSEAPGRGLIAMVLGIGPVGLLGALMLVAAGVETYMYSRGPPPDPRITAVESIEETYLSAKTTSAEQRAALVNNIDLVYEAVGASALAFQVRLARAAPCSLIWKIERSQIMQNQIVKQRPLGVTILAILAAIAAVIAAFHALQFLGLIPFFIGPYGYAVRHFNFWYALMYGLLVWVYIWLFQMLWRVDREGWIFLVIITLFYLILDTLSLLGASTWADVSVSIIVNGIILIYCMLPGVREAFGTA